MPRNELLMPLAVENDPQAMELLRAWASHGQQHVSLATGIWEDPGNWGIMLVDLAKHIAISYEQSTETTFTEALSRIRQVFDAEWDTATDEPTGCIQE